MGRQNGDRNACSRIGIIGLFRGGEMFQEGWVVLTDFADAAVETGFCSSMARNAGPTDINDEEHNVLIAIGSDVFDGQQVATFLALLPDACARTAPEMRNACSER